jgi:hypothetical protein
MTRKVTYPRTATRMTADAIALRRAVEGLVNAMSLARGQMVGAPEHRLVSDFAYEVERIATCIRADAMEINAATEGEVADDDLEDSNEPLRFRLRTGTRVV